MGGNSRGDHGPQLAYGKKLLVKDPLNPFIFWGCSLVRHNLRHFFWAWGLIKQNCFMTFRVLGEYHAHVHIYYDIYIYIKHIAMASKHLVPYPNCSSTQQTSVVASCIKRSLLSKHSCCWLRQAKSAQQTQFVVEQHSCAFKAVWSWIAHTLNDHGLAWLLADGRKATSPTQ